MQRNTKPAGQQVTGGCCDAIIEPSVCALLQTRLLLAVAVGPVFLLFVRGAFPKVLVLPVRIGLPFRVDGDLVVVPRVVIVVVGVVGTIAHASGAAAHQKGRGQCHRQHEGGQGSTERMHVVPPARTIAQQGIRSQSGKYRVSGWRKAVGATAASSSPGAFE